MDNTNALLHMYPGTVLVHLPTGRECEYEYVTVDTEDRACALVVWLGPVPTAGHTGVVPLADLARA